MENIIHLMMKTRENWAMIERAVGKMMMTREEVERKKERRA